MKLKSSMAVAVLSVFVIELVLLSVAAQAATSASAVSEMTDFFPEEALAASIKNVDDYENLAVGTKKVLSNVKTLGEAAPGTNDVTRAAFLKNVGKLTGDTANDIAKVSDVKGVEKLAHNAVSGKAGFKFEAKGISKLRQDGEPIKELSVNVFEDPITQTKQLTEIDAVGNKKLFEFKNKDWGLKDPNSDAGKDLIVKLGEQYDGYGAYMKQNNLNDFKRKAVFEDSVNPALKSKIEDIGWEVLVI